MFYKLFQNQNLQSENKPQLVQNNTINSGVQTTITRNKGYKFLNLYGNTRDLHQKVNLTAYGFKFFKGVWSIYIGKDGEQNVLNDNVKQMLNQNGIDTSIIDAPDQPNTQFTPSDQSSKSSQKIEEFKNAIEQEMANGQGNNRVKAILNHIDKYLDNLAQSVDESAKQDFVKTFLEFSGKFWNYSFSNQMLIFMQKPNSTYVRGHKQWMELGRQVVNWGNGISILAPIIKTIKDDSTTSDIGEKTILRFIPVTVYDQADTQPIPGWKDKKGNGPWEGKPPLKTNLNEDDEQITSLVNAANSFAKKLGINIDFEKDLPEDYGGHSMGGEIAINKSFKGINRFSTLIHELAHETLHWKKDRPALMSKEEMHKIRQEREIDAESTAYIVLKHYGFDTKDSPNYLALWKADSNKIRERREHISNAVKIIINGIDKEMSNIEHPDESDIIENKISSNWFNIRFG